MLARLALGAGRLASMELTGGVLTNGDYRSGQDGDGGGSDRGVVRRQPGPYDFDSDPGAAVLWFTDDPSLNEQTRFRLLDAADRIAHSRLVVIENTFNQEKLEPGKVYFLNAQKLGKKSLLIRGSTRELFGESPA